MTTNEASAASEQPEALSLKREIATFSTWQQILSLSLIVYILTVSIQRFAQCMRPWVAETDWKQWVWQYWRYHVDGAFPPGNVITDYTFNAQPPLYHLMMSTLARVFEPVVAANIVNWFAWALALWACVVAVRRRSTLLVGLMVATLFVRDDLLHKFTMGGYPRSFGPTLTLLFVAAWLNGRHRLVLLVLVVGAALYPSVCVPCGLAYGLWTAATAPRTSLKSWLRPNVEVVVVGVVVGVVAQLQSLTAPHWWGSVVWASEVGAELGPAGRSAWLPLGPFWPKVGSYFFEPWNFTGVLWKARTTGLGIPWSEHSAHLIGLGVALVCAGISVVKGRRAPVPWQLLLVLGCAVFSFFLARVVAFKLYLPHRMVQHTLPALLFVTLGLLFFTTGMTLLKDKARASIFVFAALIVPQFLISGDGFGTSRYRSYTERSELYTWIQSNTKITDQFAGYYSILDEIPLFAIRPVYVNWKMAHPFRQGFYAEIDRRTVEMYSAFYCTDLHELWSFSKKNNIAWFVVNDTMFDQLEQGDSQLFEPIRSHILDSIFTPRQTQGFALRKPPPQIVAYQQGNISVLSMAKLEAWLQSTP